MNGGRTETRIPSSPLFLALFTSGVVLVGCSDDEPAGPGGATGGELVLEGQVEGFADDAQAFGPHPGLGEGQISADGSFTVTLYGVDQVGGTRLRALDPDGNLGFLGFACEDEAYAEAGSDTEFAMVTSMSYGTDGVDVALTSSEVDITLPLPFADGTHVRWIFTEQPLDIQATCRDGEREMDLQLATGWNEVIIEAERPQHTTYIDQYTGTRPSGLSWVLEEW